MVIWLSDRRPDKPSTSINTFYLIIFAYLATSATINRLAGLIAKAPPILLDGLAFTIALLQETNIVLHVFVGGIFALGDGKRGVRAFVIAAQHV